MSDMRIKIDKEKKFDTEESIIYLEYSLIESAAVS